MIRKVCCLVGMGVLCWEVRTSGLGTGAALGLLGLIPPMIP